MVLRPETASSVTSVGLNRLQAYFVSDVHLNNHSFDRELYLENPSRLNFRKFLSDLNDSLTPADRALLVLNGDILDITGSWFDLPLPWENEHADVEGQLHHVILEIVENNREIFDELKRLLRHPHSEIIYVIGNHDGLLELYPGAQNLINKILLEDEEPTTSATSRIRFELSVELPELDMYVEHGHRLDPFNVYDPKQNPPLGDVINVLVVNRLVDQAVTRFREQGYSEELIGDLQNRLHDIEYLRPLALFPLWIETVATQLEAHPDNQGKPESLVQILHGVILETLQDPGMTRYLVERLHIPITILRMLVWLLVSFPSILPVVSFFVSKLVRRTHSNKFQYRMAQRLHHDRGYKLITFGHTHIPGVQALSHEGYFFNTGSWKPVINLFKYADNNPAHIEYLSAEERFKKVQRCGILKIEKDLSRPDSKPEFSLQTIQSGR